MDGTGEAVESMLNIWRKTKERLASNVGLGGTTCCCCALRLRDGVPGGALSFCCALRVRDETPGEEALFFGMTAKSCVCVVWLPNKEIPCLLLRNYVDISKVRQDLVSRGCCVSRSLKRRNTTKYSVSRSNCVKYRVSCSEITPKSCISCLLKQRNMMSLYLLCAETTKYGVLSC